MDISKLKSLGWQPKIALKEGLDRTYRWFVEHQGQFKAQ
jgi:GDP-L-fucose synthase